MEPATALGVAGAVVQLIDCGQKAARALHEIYKNESTLSTHNDKMYEESGALHTSISGLIKHLDALSNASQPLSDDQQRLQQVAKQCVSLDNDLLQRLDNLRISGRKRKRDAAVASLKAIKEKDKIRELHGRLAACREQLSTDLFISICTSVDISSQEQQKILQEADIIKSRLTQAFNNMGTEFQRLEDTLSLKCQRESEVTRELILNIDQRHQSDEQVRGLLKSLCFPEMYSRQEKIPDAFKGTFDWIFDCRPEATRPWSNFSKGLEVDDGTYFINGKPGSGKSTLMSFIAQDNRLEDHLKIWANGRRLLIVKFFFWRAGAAQQRTMNGMLRSILHQLLSSDVTGIKPASENLAPFFEWTNKRLLKALNEVLASIEANLSICLLLDGLDECDNDDDCLDDLADLVEYLSQRPGLKLIASSRPEPPWTDIFKTCKSLRLQDLTTSDIRRFVDGKLLKNSLMQRYREDSKEEVKMLLRGISKKANGVFLWVHLAVQEILAGLRARDTLDLLRKRLKYLDGSLNGLFKQLLRKIHPAYRVRAATCLSYLCQRDRTVSLLHLAFAEEEELFKTMRGIMHSENIATKECEWLSQHMDDFATILITQTASLLEIHSEDKLDNNLLDRRLPESLTIPARPTSNIHTPHDHFWDLCARFGSRVEVSLIHRSAIDFLNEHQEAQKLLHEGREAQISRHRAHYGILMTELFLLRGSSHLSVTNDGTLDRSDIVTRIQLNNLNLISLSIQTVLDDLDDPTTWNEDSDGVVTYASVNDLFTFDIERTLLTARLDILCRIVEVCASCTCDIILVMRTGIVLTKHLLMICATHDPDKNQDTNTWEPDCVHPWFLRNLSTEHKASAGVFLGIILDLDDFYESESCKSQHNLTKTLGMVKKLLEIGLDPHEAWSGKVARHRKVEYGARSNWEGFLLWLYHNHKIRQRNKPAVDDATFDDAPLVSKVRGQFQETLNGFLAGGAPLDIDVLYVDLWSQNLIQMSVPYLIEVVTGEVATGSSIDTAEARNVGCSVRVHRIEGIYLI